MMIYNVLIAVCLSATPAPQCQEQTAVAWVIAPEPQSSPTGCMMHGMFYAATSRLVTEGSYAKVFCTARPLENSTTMNAAAPPAAS
jgi:hypothetical protein